MKTKTKRTLKLVALVLVLLALVAAYPLYKLNGQRNEERKAEKLQEAFDNDQYDWIYKESAKPDALLYFGEQNRYMLVAKDFGYQDAHFKKNETVVTSASLPIFNESYYVQEKGKSRNRYIEKKKPLVTDYQLEIYTIHGEKTQYQSTFDVLKALQETEKYKNWIPIRAEGVYSYENHSYVTVYLWRDNDGKTIDKNNSNRGLDVCYLNLDTMEFGYDADILAAFEWAEEENEINRFFSDTNFEEQWKLEDISIVTRLKNKGYVLLRKYHDASLKNSGLYQQYPKLQKYLEKGKYAEIHFDEISLPELITMLIPEGKDPFIDAGDITYGDTVIHSLEEFRELLAQKD